MPTKTLVPRASGEGGLGATDNAWGLAYYDTGNFNKGLFVSGKNIDEVIADAVTGGGLGGVWNTAPGGIIHYNGGNVGIGTTSPSTTLDVVGTVRASRLDAATDSGFSASFSKTSHSPAIKFQGINSGVGLNYSLGVDAIDGNNNKFHINRIDDAHVFKQNLLTITSTGNVGIGTTSPDVKLEVKGASAALGTDNEIISVQTATADHRLSIGVNSDDEYAWIRSVKSGSELPLILNGVAGNVGIGTTSPVTPLHVKGSNETTFPGPGVTTIIEGTDAFGSGTAGAGISFVGKFTANDPTTFGSICVGKENLTADEYGSFMAFGTRKDSAGSNVSMEKMRITSTGNVGIGTTNPLKRLHVRHADQSSGTMCIGGSNDIYGLQFEYDQSGPTVSTIRANTVYENSSTLLKLSTNSNEEQLVLKGDGNVGIGIMSPISPLHVFGQTHNLGGLTLAAAGTNIDSLRFWIDSASTAHINRGGNVTMSITNTNNVGIGTATPSARLEVKGEQSIFTCISAAGQRFCQSNWVAGSLASSHNGYISVDSGPNGDGSIQKFVIGVADAWTIDGFQGVSIRCASSNVDSFIFKPNGNLYGKNWLSGGTISINGSGEIVSTSDKRLKNDLGDCEYGLNEVLQLKPKKYTWKDGPKNQESTIGFFAQDLRAVMEEAGPRKAKLDDKGNSVTDEDGEPDYDWGMNSNAIIAALVNSTKEQQQLIEDLRSEVEALKNK